MMILEKRKLPDYERFLALRDLLVRARFPGYTEDVAGEYWRLYDKKEVMEIDEEFIVKRLYEQYSIDKRDLFHTNFQNAEGVLAKSAEEVANWIGDVMIFVSEIEDAPVKKDSLMSRLFNVYKSKYVILEEEVREAEKVEINEEEAREDELKSHHKTSVYKILIGIASKKYGFNESHAYGKENTSIYTEIENDIDKPKTRLVNKTIKKHLRDAMKHLDDNT
ncbi:hypothetical protein [Pararhizobium mangrovi]|uniref:Uncharacterized protein n=1 Tax=Pararhizobium mangrovi TaxID=2590452 RepID=A0A506TVA0_9HYPH|nr:hypothetical protein [Pararhizobium mangrovi]TPW26002.1 hypothetical protein FJU11_16835 [Pararhizobium mangrovi]